MLLRPGHTGGEDRHEDDEILEEVITERSLELSDEKAPKTAKRGR